MGRVLFATATDPVRMVETFARSYAIIYAGSSMNVVDPTPGAMVLHAERVFGFLDCHHVGVLEGALRSVGAKARVKVRLKSPSEGDLLCTWG